MDEYKAFASIYDPILHGALYKVRKKVVDAVHRYHPSSIIDICCGTGNQLKHLKKNGFQNLTGVDISKSMLKQVAKGAENIKCDEQDATALRFHDNSFDMGIISYALHEKPYEIAKQIIREAHRVIVPGGNLVIVDYLFDKQVKFPVKAAIYAVERFAGKNHYDHFKNYISQGGLYNLMRDYQLKEEYRFHRKATGMRIYSLNKFDHYA